MVLFERTVITNLPEKNGGWQSRLRKCVDQKISTCIHVDFGTFGILHAALSIEMFIGELCAFLAYSNNLFVHGSSAGDLTIFLSQDNFY
mmetsp:Transcript_31281/g.45953  ORF Transcript_31281/g.45953 Transcript_31281/m.45953 type:complete len:89 (-) Transcript_31281:485-751(-)